jgi:hypothetical protein
MSYRGNLQGKTNMRQQSINDILQAAFQILTYEKVSHQESLLPPVPYKYRPRGQNLWGRRYSVITRYIRS